MKVKTDKKKVSNKVSTTEKLDNFIKRVVNSFEVIDNRFDVVLDILSKETIEEDNVLDSDIYFSYNYIIRDKEVLKIKYLTEGFSLQPQSELDVKANKFTFKKGEDLTIEVEGNSLNEAVEALKERIRASKNIEIISYNEK